MSSSSALWLLLLWGKLKARARDLMLLISELPFLPKVRLSWIKLRVPLSRLANLTRDLHSHLLGTVQ